MQTVENYFLIQANDVTDLQKVISLGTFETGSDALDYCNKTFVNNEKYGEYDVRDFNGFFKLFSESAILKLLMETLDKTLEECFFDLHYNAETLQPTYLLVEQKEDLVNAEWFDMGKDLFNHVYSTAQYRQTDNTYIIDGKTYSIVGMDLAIKKLYEYVYKKSLTLERESVMSFWESYYEKIKDIVYFRTFANVKTL